MKTELVPGLLKYQEEWLADESRFKIGLWARQTGKDFTCAAEAVLDCVRTPGCHWLILGCGERQARESLEKAREFARTLEERFAGSKKEEGRIKKFGEVEGSGGAQGGGLQLGGRTAEIGFPSPPRVGGPSGDVRFANRGVWGTDGTDARTDIRLSASTLSPSRVLIKRESATELRFWNGSRITALPAKAGTIRGYSANLILTEFAFHDDPEGIWRAIFPSVSNPLRGGVKKVRIISTPNGLGNYFHELWMNSPIFSRHRVTIDQAVEAGLPMDVETLKAGLLDAEGWAQEYECEFADQRSVLLPYGLIDGCEAAEAMEASGLDQLSRSVVPNGTPELFLGIDFGRKQDLTVCWSLERVSEERLRLGLRLGLGEGEKEAALTLNRNPAVNPFSLMTREVLAMRRMGTPEQIEALRPRVRLARKVCVDYTGAGVGLGDALRAEFGSKVELCTFTAGLKEEIFVKLRAAMERRGVWIPKGAEIREDLHAVHRVVSSTGQISFRASRSADGHSDRCTALALAVRAGESAPVSQAPSTVWNPYRMLGGRAMNRSIRGRMAR